MRKKSLLDAFKAWKSMLMLFASAIPAPLIIPLKKLTNILHKQASLKNLTKSTSTRGKISASHAPNRFTAVANTPMTLAGTGATLTHWSWTPICNLLFPMVRNFPDMPYMPKQAIYSSRKTTIFVTKILDYCASPRTGNALELPTNTGTDTASNSFHMTWFTFATSAMAVARTINFPETRLCLNKD